MSIFIPTKINVGYQKRKDTYTGKLAYIIYYDERGKLRKETSWQNWRNKNIPNNEYDNVPTEGFVLNKKVGGYKSGWDFRQTYARVYDPRGFEFEITMENLLWILECCSSIKGKGLEGEFVYGYDGGNLLLIPTDSPDYQKFIAQSKAIQDNLFVKGSELVVGATYKSRNDIEYIYLGRYNYYKKEENYLIREFRGSLYHPRYKDVGWEYPLDDSWQTDISYKPKTYRFRYKNMGKYYWFAEICTSYYSGEKYYRIYPTKSVSKRFFRAESNHQDKYSELYEKMIKLETFSPIKYSESKLIYIPFDIFEQQCNKLQNNETNDALNVSTYNDEYGIEKYVYLRYNKEKSTFYHNGINFDTIKSAYDNLKPCFVKHCLENGEILIKGYNYGYEE
jgi:hypothetical protein